MANDREPGADPIDRVGPTRRPAGRVVMRQSWADLLFLHWAVDPELLRPLLPPGLTLDLHDGRAYVGLVPFAMRRVRPTWAPALPWLSNFLETNVRTYVHHEGRDPGVWFFSLDAANPVAVVAARTLWHLPYYHARMVLSRPCDGTISYESERRERAPAPAGLGVTYTPTGPIEPAAPGTLEHFLAERYILYAQRGACLYRGRVHHPPYPLQTAVVAAWSESLLAANGIERPRGEPLAHYATGVDVDIFGLERVAQPQPAHQLWPGAPAAGWAS